MARPLVTNLQTKHRFDLPGYPWELIVTLSYKGKEQIASILLNTEEPDAKEQQS